MYETNNFCKVIALTGVFKRISKCHITVNPSNMRSLKRAPNKHEPALLVQTLVTCSRGGQLLILKERESTLLSDLDRPSKDGLVELGLNPWFCSVFSNLKSFEFKNDLIGVLISCHHHVRTRWVPYLRKKEVCVIFQSNSMNTICLCQWLS